MSWHVLRADWKPFRRGDDGLLHLTTTQPEGWALTIGVADQATGRLHLNSAQVRVERDSPAIRHTLAVAAWHALLMGLTETDLA